VINKQHMRLLILSLIPGGHGISSEVKNVFLLGVIVTHFLGVLRLTNFILTDSH